jgi:hypothetical protein
MQLKPMRVGGVHLYTTGLSGVDRRLTGVKMVDSLASTVARCVESAGEPQVAIIPEGPYVVPVYRPSA